MNATTARRATPCTAVTADGRFVKLPTELLTTVSPRAVQVYAAIARHADATSRCHPSQQHLADDLDCGVATIERAVAELLATPFLAVVGRRSTAGGAVNVYRVGRPPLAAVQAVVEVERSPVDSPEVPLTSEGQVPITSEGQNESQWNDTPTRSRATVDSDQVDELLDRLPDRVRRRVSRSHRGLRKQLACALERRTISQLANQLTGNDWPPLDDVDSPAAVIAYRLARIAEQTTTATTPGCRACAASPARHVWAGDYVEVKRACPEHDGQPVQVVAA